MKKLNSESTHIAYLHSNILVTDYKVGNSLSEEFVLVCIQRQRGEKMAREHLTKGRLYLPKTENSSLDTLLGLYIILTALTFRTECSKFKGTHKDHQLLSPHRIKEKN